MSRLAPHAFVASLAALLCSLMLQGQPGDGSPRPAGVGQTHTKAEHMVPMRDGTTLYTAVFAPTTCPAGGAPILLQRTPYGSGPYGADAFPQVLGPSRHFQDDGYVVVYQDVRGRYMSEGSWEEVRPHIPAKHGSETDESSDAYDTVDWLVKHVPCNNGRVGIWGISYPGFYALAALIDAHPALKAVSPQGPVTDYYLNDDSYHNGAFMLAHNFSFYVDFFPRGPRPQQPLPGTTFDYGTTDGYRFYLQAGSLMEMTRRHGLDRNPYWMMNLEHTAYDAFWKARSIWRHLHDVKPAVLVVGGWYDAENLQGPLRAFRALREQSPGTQSHLVMGPWTHGSWSRSDGSRVGQLAFGSPTGTYFRAEIERRFFARLLRGEATTSLPNAMVFETGSNRWLTSETWPPSSTGRRYFFSAEGALSTVAPREQDARDEYVSDPANPVPAVAHEAIGMPPDYMASDQRFAASRPDVLVYRSAVLARDVTVRGPIGVSLHVATSGTDSDFVVKVLDEYGHNHPQAGTQQLVRGEPFRGKFRKSLEAPAAFEPNVPDEIRFDLPDVAHTFRKGHRIVVHVQSSWLPIFDRNPQTFTDIPTATAAQFVKATQRVYRSATRPSHITLPVVRAP